MELDLDELTRLWDTRWPLVRPIGHQLREGYPDRWVRFHALPESKRYPQDDAEYEVVFDRHLTVLRELAQTTPDMGAAVLISGCWSTDPKVSTRQPQLARLNADASRWNTFLLDDSDPGSVFFVHLHVGRVELAPNALHPLLRLVADDEVRDVVITEPSLRWLFAPYDGGADVLLATSAERDALRRRHADWLSAHPGGL